MSATTRALRLPFLLILLAMLTPRPVAFAAPAQQKIANKASAAPGGQNGLVGNATLPTLTFTDPRTGKLLWKATARTLNAQTGAASNVVGTMQDVHGVFFQNGVAADHITADTVSADQSSKEVTASGSVLVRSITDPTTSIRCDRVVWHADTNMMLGTGHVVFKKGGFMQTGPSFQADTRMRTLVMPAPSTGGKIRATLRTGV
jgi:hypothetical protein